MSEAVLAERSGAVGIVTLNMPEKRNALGRQLYPQLLATLDELQREDSIRAIVLTGGRHFCAGGDIDDLDTSAATIRREMQSGQRIIRSIVTAPVPVVAAVEGNAYGAGFSLAMACDFVVADEHARFCAAVGRVGLTPDYGLLWTLPQRIGIARTRELVMLCSPIAGKEAEKWRLVDRLAEPGQVLQVARELAARLATQSRATLSTTKAVLSRLPLNLDAMLAWEADTQALLVQGDDFSEGARAFAERRDPVFR
jgi:enoyl-CoA hydratase/carnithine racemase